MHALKKSLNYLYMYIMQKTFIPEQNLLQSIVVIDEYAIYYFLLQRCAIL